MPGENTGEVELDMNSALDDMSTGLGFGTDEGGDTDDDLTLDDGEDGQPLIKTPAATPAAAPATPAGAPTPAPAPGPNDPPRTWRKEATEHWAQLPENVRQEVLKREEDMFKGLEQYKADAGFAKTVRTVLDPFMPVLQQHGIDPVQQIGGLMRAHHTLALGTPQQKLELFQKLAQDYRVDLNQLAAGDPPFIDPAVQALQNDLQGVRSQLDARNRADAQAAQEKLTKEIDTFAADPANVYFNDLANDMVRLLDTGVAKSLKDAYDQAIWLNPVTRQKEVDRQQADSTKKAEEEAKRKAEAAKQASAANVRAKARSGSAAAPLGSIDDTLNETLARINSRG